MVVVERTLCAPRSAAEVVRGALRGGATSIQVRNKGDSAREQARAVRALLPLGSEWGVPIIVNDRLDVALATGADGVHLGPEDLPPRVARRVAPEGFLVGYSTDQPAEAARAARLGVSYVGCGAVFPTRTKRDADDPIGPEGVRRVAFEASVPVVAIGGVTARNASRLAGSGAAGIAAVGAFMSSADPETTARRLMRAVGHRVGPGRGPAGSLAPNRHRAEGDRTRA